MDRETQVVHHVRQIQMLDDPCTTRADVNVRPHKNYAVVRLVKDVSPKLFLKRTNLPVIFPALSSVATDSSRISAGVSAWIGAVCTVGESCSSAESPARSTGESG